MKIPFSRDARDLGGLFYDEKHVTAYGNFVRGELPGGNPGENGIDKIIYIGNQKVQFEVNCEIFPPSYERSASGLCACGDGYTGFSAAFDSLSLIGNVLKGALKSEGTVMFCGDPSCCGVDAVVAVLYLLCGVSEADIVKDRALSLKLLKEDNQQNVNCATDEEFLSALKDFKRTYADTREYLYATGLNGEEISDLERRMKSVSPRYI